MGDRLVQTFLSVCLFLQVQLAGKCKLATLLRNYVQNTESTMVVCSYVGIKTGNKNEYKLWCEIVSKVGSKDGTKNSVLAFLKCMDKSVLAFLKCTDGSVLVSLKHGWFRIGPPQVFSPICPLYISTVGESRLTIAIMHEKHQMSYLK